MLIKTLKAELVLNSLKVKYNLWWLSRMSKSNICWLLKTVLKFFKLLNRKLLSLQVKVYLQKLDRSIPKVS